MGLFNLFNKKSKEPEKSSEYSLVLQGPRYLRQYLTTPKLDAGKIRHPKIEWAGQLISSTGSTLFQIKYFGTRETLIEFTNESGQIEFDNGQHLDMQDAFDDAFDGLSVYAIDESGKKFQIIDEELA